ncbi:unnamed protein product [Mesocestoides corti]|uniref:Uncharacterized protein n=1 Tax=Mesocestoides corti TaxID=53468 RepID=A0A3P6HJA9_MESCO|nr:unnamed protein product [Mesocestoides corti]
MSPGCILQAHPSSQTKQEIVTTRHWFDCSTTDFDHVNDEPTTDSPMVRSLHNLIESARLAKTTSSSNSGSSGQSAGVRFIATLVHSLLTHYRPPRWADLPEGLQAMEHLKDAHMITLRHLLSCEQSSWVAREVTC